MLLLLVDCLNVRTSKSSIMANMVCFKRVYAELAWSRKAMESLSQHFVEKCCITQVVQCLSSKICGFDNKSWLEQSDCEGDV